MHDDLESNEALSRSFHREAIRDLVARYNSYADSGKFDLLFELFVPEAVMEIRSVDGSVSRQEGLDQVKTIFTGTRDQLAKDSGEASARSYMRHFTATHQIDVGDGGRNRAAGRCYFAVLMPHGLDHWGRYIDRYVVADGCWRFAHRTVRVDGRVDQSPFNR